MDKLKQKKISVDDVQYLKIVMGDGEEGGETITFSVANAKNGISDEDVEEFADVVIGGELFQTASGSDLNTLVEAYYIKTVRQNLV